MSFETPAALWGLLSLVLLVIFSLWRQAAVRVTVPSVSLWKRLPERNPPIRALRRPRWRTELLFQALAITAAVAALAGPYLSTDRSESREIALVFDTSARFRAGNRIDRMREEARGLLDGGLRGDRVALFASTPAPSRLKDLDELRAVDVHVDLRPLVDAAREVADEVIVFTDRAVPGARTRLLGGPQGNVGFVGFTAADDEVFVRIANHGAAREVKLTLVAGEARVEETLALAEGLTSWSRREDFSGAGSVTVELATGDAFALDDRVRATRLSSVRAAVTLTGQASAPLRRVLASIPGVFLLDGRGEALLSVGLDDLPGPASLRVHLHSPRVPREPKRMRIVDHPLTRDLAGREKEIGSVGIGEVPPEAAGGTPLITADGRTVLSLRGNEIHLAISMDPGRWPAGPRSFPIFWTNVVDFSRNGAASFSVVRTGRPADLPDDVVSVEPGGTRLPGGTFVAYRVGPYEVRRPGSVASIRANLLDARETDVAGFERPLDWSPADPAGRETERRPLGAWAAALAILFLAVAWLLERRPD